MSIQGTLSSLQPFNGNAVATVKSSQIAAPRLTQTCKKHAPQVTCRAHSGDSGPSNSIPDALPFAGVDTDWRSFRAKLVNSTLEPTTTTSSEEGGECWAHALTGPEQGCLLVANPLLFLKQQQYFYKAVILLFKHGPDGSAGVILNKPTPATVGQIPAMLNILGPDFTSNRIHLGGDVDPGSLIALHDLSSLPNSIEIIPGLSMGGINESLQKAVDEGRVRPERFRFYSQYCGWGPGQLEEECRRGVWYTAAASHHVVKQPVISGLEGAMWTTVMQMMGGDYPQIAEAANETYRADIMGGVIGQNNIYDSNSGLVQNNNNSSEEQEKGDEGWNDTFYDEIGGTGI